MWHYYLKTRSSHWWLGCSTTAHIVLNLRSLIWGIIECALLILSSTSNRLAETWKEDFSTPGLGVRGREWAHSIVRPWVPISSPLTHLVYLLPILSYLAGFKSVCTCPSVRPEYDDKYRSTSYHFVERQIPNTVQRTYAWRVKEVTLSIHLNIFKRNAEAFLLNAIVDVCRRRHEMIFLLISRKLLELATSNFTTR